MLSRSLLTLDVLRRETSVGRRLGKNGILKYNSLSRCIKVSRVFIQGIPVYFHCYFGEYFT